VERDANKAERARNDDFEVVEGDGAREAVLAEVDLESADALGALTGDLNVNFAACMVANHHGARTVLRIDEDYREDIYRKFASDVDEVVYPERLGAIGAKNALLVQTAVDHRRFAFGKQIREYPAIGDRKIHYAVR